MSESDEITNFTLGPKYRMTVFGVVLEAQFPEELLPTPECLGTLKVIDVNVDTRTITIEGSKNE